MKDYFARRPPTEVIWRNIWPCHDILHQHTTRSCNYRTLGPRRCFDGGDENVDFGFSCRPRDRLQEPNQVRFIHPPAPWLRWTCSLENMSGLQVNAWDLEPTPENIARLQQIVEDLEIVHAASTNNAQRLQAQSVCPSIER